MFHLDNEKLEQIYFSDLPKYLFWIGLIVCLVYGALFAIGLMITGKADYHLLLPTQSEFTLGVVALLLSYFISRNGLVTVVLSLFVPICVLLGSSRHVQAASSVSGPLPVEMLMLAVVTLELIAAGYFVILTISYFRKNRFPR